MFWKKNQSANSQKAPSFQRAITTEGLKEILSNMEDAEMIERELPNGYKLNLFYIRTLIDLERLNESIVDPILQKKDKTIIESITTANVLEIKLLGEAKGKIEEGSILINETKTGNWYVVPLKNPLSRSIETSETESILYGPKDSFSEQVEQNIALIRRRLPTTDVKAEKITVGGVSKTSVVILYIEGITNPEYVTIAREKLKKIDFDVFLDSSQIAGFMEDHEHSLFPQFQQTDRPDTCSHALSVGRITILVDNTPFALNAPITFFHLFQSPEDYINRWLVASFLRMIRYVSYVLSMTLIPSYVAVATHHYQMIPVQLLFVLIESRTKLPFSPFWEALIMLLILEIIKEASLRMPTKSSQTLGVIGGIVIGQAAVEAGLASKILIVLVGISTIASFLVPNYLMTKANTLVQFAFLILSVIFGIPGIVIGFIILLAHLNGITSLNQPYLAPVTPLFIKDWNDLFIRGPITKMKERPEFLRPMQKLRYTKRR